MKSLAEAGEHGMVELVMATHAGLANDDFESIVKEWLSTARHPKFNRPYTELDVFACEPLQDLHCVRRRH
jgi:hypothetical protein